MSHITCPKCGSNEHYCGYGLACGGLAGYTICECGEVLEYLPDEANREPPADKGDATLEGE